MRSLLVLASVVAATAAAQAAEPPSKGWKKLCPAGTAGVAGCVLKGGKMVAFCSAGGGLDYMSNDMKSKPEVLDSDTLVYRFGKPGKVEMAFPKGTAGSAGKFRGRGFASMYHNLIWLGFTNGGFRYVYHKHSFFWRGGGGFYANHLLRVEQGGRTVARFTCDDHDVSRKPDFDIGPL